jgi:hypothetical protein
MALYSWIASSLIRHFPLTPVQQIALPTIEAALNEQFSFQVVMRMEDEEPQRARIEVVDSQGFSVRVRRVGYVPLLHHNIPIEQTSTDTDGLGYIPGYVPDPLFDEDSIFLPPAETHAFWINVRPDQAATPGRHSIEITLLPEKGKKITHIVHFTLHGIVLKKREDFPITNWFYVDSFIDWYKTDLFDNRFWKILPRYIQNVVEHGQDTLYIPVFTPPLDGIKRPSQLLGVTRKGPDEYDFDWRGVAKYIKLAKACGITHFEWSHPFVQEDVKYAIRIYENQGKDERLLWDPKTEATSNTYRAFLAQYLAQLYRFLSEEEILDTSFFHVSDEARAAEHIRDYQKARSMLKDLAPWMKVMDALSETEFARQGLTDMPVAITETALEFVQNNIPCWCYYCCVPRGKYLNRLLDTPLPKIAMHGFLFYRWPFRGFLHWGYNYWYQARTRNLIDPYTVQDGLEWGTKLNWPYGDPFVVYPGPNGPIDSIRWEIFSESLQDYALLQTLRVDRNDPLFTPIKSFADFPKTEKWRSEARTKLFARKKL